MAYTEDMLETLRMKGYRITPQREAVLAVLTGSRTHMSADEVFHCARERAPSLNLATVYRTLDVLVENGLASRADLGGGKVVYAPEVHGSHVHLVCTSCGKVIEGELQGTETFLKWLEKTYGFVCSPRHFAVNGLCRRCRPHS